LKIERDFHGRPVEILPVDVPDGGLERSGFEQ
jgi:hypothetical protein